MSAWFLSRVGDAGLVVSSARQEIDPTVSARVLWTAEEIRRRGRAGIRDVVESYCAVTVHFDPLRTDVDRLMSELGEVMADEERVSESASDAPLTRPSPRLVTVPVHYGGNHGPDLAVVAEQVGCTEADVIDLHASETYRVYMLGFLPGFAYMGSLSPRLALSRLTKPRIEVPRGSVGIAGRQTGVYPMAAPGGWHLIGRTPLRPFDMRREDPFLFRTGDAVRFEPVLGTLATTG